MATIDTISTTTTSTSTRTGVGIVVTDKTTTTNLDLVSGVEIQPYIANRIVSFYAYNMRPNQRLHVFFDSVKVDDYCAPGEKYPGGNYKTDLITSTDNYKVISKDGDWGTPIYSDLFGQVAGQFNIPAGKFKTGDRVLQLCDADSIIRGSDAISTSSSAHFNASNITVTRQPITLTTVNPEISTQPIVNTVVTTDTTTQIVIHPDIGVVTGSWYEPIAQGLTINTPSGESGVFITSIDLFFKQKSKVMKNGVTVYICETNNGYPDGSKILPFSTTHLTWDQVAINHNDSTSYTAITATNDTYQPATNFKFESPVYLNNASVYAFVVKPDAGDPDYWVYSANLGDIDLVGGNQVFSQPTIGTAFYGATDGQWTALQTEYIKFELYRAKFNQQNGEATFVNSDTDFISVYNVGYSSLSSGILAGDYVFQSTSEVPASACTSVHGIITYYDEVKGLIYAANSTGNFSPNLNVQVHRFDNATKAVTPGPNSTTIVAHANSGMINNLVVDLLVPQFAAITPPGTSLSFKYKGTSNTFTADSTEIPVNIGTDNEFYDYQRIVASYTNQNEPSLTLKAYMTTDSEFISPLIDTVKNQQLIVANEIDPIGFDYEEFYNYGASKSKYISKLITLANGQDAEDLNVIITAHRPNKTDIQVWVKFLNGEDSDSIVSKTWFPMINSSAVKYSEPNNPADMNEYVFTVPKYYGMIPTSGTITSTSACTVITGASTTFLTDLKPGYYINMLANSTFQETSRKVIAVNSDSQIILEKAFNGSILGGYTSKPYFVVPPPTTPYLAVSNEVELTGTVSTEGTNIITGSITSNFTGELSPGSIIKINGDEQAIVSITNSTSLAVGTGWSSSVSDVQAYRVDPAGVTYLNIPIKTNTADTGNLFTSFKRFQIKVILQSNDSSRVPLINDIRALALQL